MVRSEQATSPASDGAAMAALRRKLRRERSVMTSSVLRIHPLEADGFWVGDGPLEADRHAA